MSVNTATLLLVVVAFCGALLRPETWLASLIMIACCGLQLLLVPTKRLMREASTWDVAVVIVCAFFTLLSNLR